MLPVLQAGIWRHYKGHYYQVFGYAHDANDAYRFVVVYMGIQTEASHTGPRMAVRTVDDFFMLLHEDDHTDCQTMKAGWRSCKHGGRSLIPGSSTMRRSGSVPLIEPVHDGDVPESSPWVVVGREYRGNWVPCRTFTMAKDDLLIHQAKVELDAERTRNAQR